MGVLDFLFDGRPPASVTTYGTQTTNVPTWLSDYTQGVIARGNAVAAEPYQPYQGPRIANFTGDQQSAFDLARSNAGRYTPVLNRGISQVGANAGQGALTSAQGLAGAAQGVTQGALGMSLQGAAQPYMDQAGKTFTGQNVADYMNPYTENVINRAGTLAGQQWKEKILPGLEDIFTRNGQYGSTAHQQQADIGARDLATNLQEQSQAALSQGYTQAGSMFGADQQRQGALAQLAGQLAGQQQSNTLQGGQQMGALSQILGQLGATQGDLALRGGTALADMARQGQSMGAADVASLDAVGNSQQQLNQRNLDLAYQDYQNQLNYPRQQVDWLSNLIRGIPNSAIPTSAATTSTGPASAYQPSPLATVASLLAGLKGIGSLTQSGP